MTEVLMEVFACVGLAESKRADIIIFPNPSRGYLTFSPGYLKHNCIASIWDINGKFLFEKSLYGNHPDIRDLPEGVYLLRLHSEGRTFGNVRIVKE
jgi:hypothetical protein